MKEEISKFKNAVNETAAAIKTWKVWERRAPALKTDPFPGMGNKLRATLLCMILAHSRGKLHCRTVWGRESRRVELSSMADQRKFIEEHIAKGWRPPLDAEEAKIAKKLLDWGDIGRHIKETQVQAEPVPISADGSAA